MNAKKIYFISASIGIVSAILVLTLYGFIKKDVPTKEQNAQYTQQITERYKIFSLPLPEQLDFAGEQVPMDLQDVREKFDRELLVNTYWQSNTLLCIKRAHRWFPVIEPILSANQIPDDFKYLALIESAYTQAVSPAGAVGFWQFIDPTARSYGIEINDEVDERYHIEKSTQAACNYLNEAYKKYGSWSLAAASYNMGMVGPARQIERQGQSNYWNLLLNEETGRYVYRILAMKHIVNNADQYGFVIRPADLYEPLKYKTVIVNYAIDDLATFAKEYAITYKDLKIFNPWLRENFLKNKNKKSYEVKIPLAGS